MSKHSLELNQTNDGMAAHDDELVTKSTGTFEFEVASDGSITLHLKIDQIRQELRGGSN